MMILLGTGYKFVLYRDVKEVQAYKLYQNDVPTIISKVTVFLRGKEYGCWHTEYSMPSVETQSG
jgi:hypothetical protein